MNQEKIDKEVIIAVVAGIVILEGIALLKGLNGMLLTTVLAILAGIGGWSLPQLRTK